MAVGINEEVQPEKPPPTGEICLISSPSIILSQEMEIGTDTIPVLVLQASFNAQVKDWSSNVSLNFLAQLIVG